MIKRLRFFILIISVLIIQLMLIPIVTNAADIVSTADTTSTSPLLKVELKPGSETGSVGELIGFDIKVSNLSPNLVASSCRLIDILPPNFKFAKGSALLDGKKISDPVISTDSRALTFLLGNLAPSTSTSIHFDTKITSDIILGKVVNVASSISSSAGKSNLAKSIISVTAQTLTISEPVAKAEPDAEKITEYKPAEVKVVTPPLTHSEESAQIEKTPENIIVTTPDKPAKVEKQADVSVQDVITHNLVSLTGKSEIPVLTDVDGKYVKNMNEAQLLEKSSSSSATQIAESNLSESIHVGRSFSRESLAAAARTEQAKAQTGQVFGALLPSVIFHVNSGLEISQPSSTVDANGSQVPFDSHSRTDASLTVRQPLFDLPSYKDFRRREVIEKSRNESYRISDGDAYIAAVNAYLSLVSSRLQSDMTNEFETQLNELLLYVEKRAKAGAASNSDMARVRARSQATRSSRLEQESAHAAAGIEFVRLTNLVPQKVRVPKLDDVGVSLLPKSFDLAVTEAMKSNPEITSLATELQAAEMDKSSAKGRYLPRVDAEYTYNYALHAGGDTNSSGQKDQRIMAVLNWNIFSGGTDYNTTVERTARQKELEYRLDDQRRRVIQTLSANYATLATTRERITSGYQELASITTAAEAMSKRMLSGNQSLLDLLDVYDRFYQVRSRLVTLHVLEMSTVAQLVRLTRGAPDSTPSVK